MILKWHKAGRGMWNGARYRAQGDKYIYIVERDRDYGWELTVLNAVDVAGIRVGDSIKASSFNDLKSLCQKIAQAYENLEGHRHPYLERMTVATEIAYEVRK